MAHGGGKPAKNLKVNGLDASPRRTIATCFMDPAHDKSEMD
jgi:hypothetical protein